jgi:hypothetical protein
MDKFTQHIDKIIQKVLNEAAEEKASEVSEKLHGGQKKIDKNKNGKIDSEDFKLLRKKKDMKEQPNEGSYVMGSDGKPRGMKPGEKFSAFSPEDFGDDDDSMEGELDIDFDEFDPRDKSWEEIKAHTGDDYSEIDEQEMEDPKDGELDEWFYFYNKDGDESTPGDYEGDEEEEEEAEELSAQEPTYVGKGLEDNKPGKMFGSFSDEHGWYDESDRRHKGDFDFEYDEEEFEDFPSMYEKIGKNQKWFAPGKEGQRFFDVYKEKFGSPFKVRTRREMGEQETEEGNEFTEKLMQARKDGDKTMKVGGKVLPVKESVQLSETELIDLIEKIVKEQASQKPKGNIATKVPKGLEVTDNVLKQDKKENDDNLAAVGKKMNEYLKDGSKGKYDPNPKGFPVGNGQIEKMAKKAYQADSDVEEYIEDFAYGGGMENLDYDEIKPNEEWMEKTLEGSSKTGNSSEYANAVETELGKKINAKRKKNMFSNEKKNSYKRVDQPTSGSNKNKVEKDSDKLFAKLESTEDKSHKLVVEQIDKMKKLFSYNEKTQ